MASGTAIVCSDIHGYKGVVKRGEQALLVPPGESRPLAEAILRLLADPDLRARMGASGLDRVVEFGWERIAARVEAYYGFVIRRLAAQGALPRDFHAEVPPDPRGSPIA
jgi:phosphatidylinositol alpha-mannosyltransferase